MSGLTMEDVQRLASDPSPAARAGTAAKLAQQFNASKFSPAEIRLAEQIFRVMVCDAEVRVREALSANLKYNPHVPRDVAVALAQDVDSVALPILNFSEVLTSDDLVQIIHGQGSLSKMEAIAGRRDVEPDVCAALVDVGTEKIAAKLVSNPGANIGEAAMHKLVDRFGDSELVQEPLVRRAELPVTIAERLVSRVADHLRTQLLTKHRVSPDVALDLMMQSRERATVGLAMGVADSAIAALVRQLKDNNRLTPSLLLRAICMGNLRFFEHGVAVLSGVPIANARVLVHDPGAKGLKSVLAKAGLPASHFPAVLAALDAVAKTELDGRELDPERYARRIIERVLTQYETLGLAFDDDDIEYLLARVNRLPPASFAVH